MSNSDCIYLGVYLECEVVPEAYKHYRKRCEEHGEKSLTSLYCNDCGCELIKDFVNITTNSHINDIVPEFEDSEPFSHISFDNDNNMYLTGNKFEKLKTDIDVEDEYGAFEILPDEIEKMKSNFMKEYQEEFAILQKSKKILNIKLKFGILSYYN